LIVYKIRAENFNGLLEGKNEKKAKRVIEKKRDEKKKTECPLYSNIVVCIWEVNF
jgi:hypothetical protein